MFLYHCRKRIGFFKSLSQARHTAPRAWVGPATLEAEAGESLVPEGRDQAAHMETLSRKINTCINSKFYHYVFFF